MIVLAIDCNLEDESGCRSSPAIFRTTLWKAVRESNRKQRNDDPDCRPYRSGTNDDPALIRNKVEQRESYALPIFRAGHIPMLGEWVALPLVELAGSKKIG